MSLNPSICFLNTEGTNCNEDMANAFRTAGAPDESLHQVHINELRAGTHTLEDDQILILSGGFSYGDDIRAGARFGLELKLEFTDQLNRFVEQGKLVLGVCNGFQVLAETGLLPYGNIDPERPKGMTLTNNDVGKFDCRWGHLAVEATAACPFFNQAVVGEVIELPWAHAEGKTRLSIDLGDPDEIAARGLIIVRYADQEGKIVDEFPANPNGSDGAIAGVCNEQGNVAALMPHPERFIYPYHHPEYHRSKIRGDVVSPAGLPIFKQMLEVASQL